MKRVKKHIEIVRTTNPELSSLSQESCDAIVGVLTRHYAVVGVTTVNNLEDLELLVAMQPDLVFMGLKYLPGRTQPGEQQDQKIWVSEYLDQNGIDHTGSCQQAIEFELNKPLAKQRILEAGLKTSPFIIIKNGESLPVTEFPLQFPVFVKPAALGGGKGIDDGSLVYNLPDLQAKAQHISTKYSADALVEEYLPGREFSVAILRNEGSEELMVMPVEMVAESNTDGNSFLSSKIKSLNQETVLPVNDEVIRERIIDAATRVFYALGARDYGRLDLRMDASGAPHFLEANLIPSLIEGYGSFPKSCSINIDMDYETMILHIVGLGLSRTPLLLEQETEPAFPILFAQPTTV